MGAPACVFAQYLPTRKASTCPRSSSCFHGMSCSLSLVGSRRLPRVHTRTDRGERARRERGQPRATARQQSGGAGVIESRKPSYRHSWVGAGTLHATPLLGTHTSTTRTLFPLPGKMTPWLQLLTSHSHWSSSLRDRYRYSEPRTSPHSCRLGKVGPWIFPCPQGRFCPGNDAEK